MRFLKRLVCMPAVELAVVEAGKILESLRLIKCRSGLDGGQRQLLQETISSIEFAIDSQTDGNVNLSTDVITAVLRFYSDSQNFWTRFE